MSPVALQIVSVSDKQLLNPVSIRFSKPLKLRLGIVSKKFQIKEAEVVRRALEFKLPEWEASQEMVIMATREVSK